MERKQKEYTSKTNANASKIERGYKKLGVAVRAA